MPAPPGASGRSTSTPASSGPPAASEEIEKQARVLQLIHAYRVRGHLVADLDPLDSQARAAQGPRSRDLRPHHLGPRPRVHHQRPRRHGPGHPARDPGGPARHLLRHHRRRVHVHRRPRAQGLAAGAHGVHAATALPLDTAARRRILEKLVEAESFERFLHAKYVGHKRFSLEGCEAAHPAARPRAHRRRARRACARW